MNIFKLNASREDLKVLLGAFIITSIIFSGFYAKYAHGEAVILTVNVQAALTFTTASDNFGNLNPGTVSFATTTLSVETNAPNGWNVTLEGDDQGTSNTVCDLDSDAGVGLTDQTEWIPGSATTSAGNAVRISAFDNSGDVLAFRVMTASGSAPFLASTWWGTTDDYVDSATTLWAGIASTTAANTKIGDTSINSGGDADLNTVLYYLDVPAGQTTGAYSCPLTFTASSN